MNLHVNLWFRVSRRKCSITLVRSLETARKLLAVSAVACFWFCVSGIVPTLSAQEQDSTSKTVPAKLELADVRPLLRQLEADTLAERDAAEDQLIQLGAGVLPFLPQIDDRTSGELKIRLQRIRGSFEATELEAFFEASTVTLSGGLALQDALDAISDQTGNAIQLQGADAFSDTEVSTDFSETPFWEAIDSLIAQANLRINTFGTTGNELVLGPGAPIADDAPLAFQSGPFRVEPAFLQATRQFNSQLPGQLQVSLHVSWEPRLEPVFMQIPMRSLQAESSGGAEIAATNPQAAPEIPLNFGGCTTQIDLQVSLPDRDDDKLKRLSGEFVIAVPGEKHAYEFEGFANGARQAKKFGDVSVVLEGARRNGKVYEMRIRIEFGDAQGALDSFRGFILSNQAYLLDKKETRYENIGLNTYAMGNNAVGIAYLFQINGDPKDYKLVYESPSSVTKQTVSYELKDIPLP